MSRYDRQIRLEEVGVSGQKKLAKARVLCVGAGGLGSPVLYYLASAGIGTLGIVDGDKVDLTNLQRQILFTESDCGLPKARLAKARLQKLNSAINIISTDEYLTEENAENFFADYDLIVDGTDSFATKFLINKTAKKLNKPWVYGSVTGFEGQIAFFDPQGSCLQCLVQKVPRQNQFSCAEAGVLGAMVGWIGSIQALEVIRYFINFDTAQFNQQLNSQLLYIDGLSYSQRKFEIPLHQTCPICLASNNTAASTEYSLKAEFGGFGDSESNKSESSKLESDFSESTKSEFKYSDLAQINIENYYVIDLSEQINYCEFKSDYRYSIADLFTQDQLPTEWLATDRPLLFCCESGYKSQSALNYLQSLGFKNVTHLRGGLAKWKQAKNLGETRI